MSAKIRPDNVKYPVVNKEGHSELAVNAVAGDTVVWSMSTFDAMRLYSAHLYDSKFNPADGVSCLSYESQQVTNNLPAPNGVNSLSPGPITSYRSQLCWVSAKIEKTEQIQYSMSFQVIDNNGDSIGYFSWDPFFELKIG